MSFQPGEAVWYETYDAERRLLEHRKPWLPDRVGDILAEAGAILSLLPPPPCRVLDAGCADGYLTHMLSLCGYWAEGIDVCEEVLVANSLSQVRWNHLESSPEFYSRDFDSLSKDSFNAIIFASALHHSMDRRRTLKSAYEALLPGGVLIASEPGLGHGMRPATRKWAKDMQVTERSTPPLALAWTGWRIGFRHIRVYPNPVTIHKAAYKGVPIPLFVLACAKWLHGVTVMYKP